MDTVSNAVHCVFLIAACSVIGLHLMNHRRTGRRGNTLSAGAMAVAIVATVWLVVHEGPVPAGSFWSVAVSSAPRSACGPHTGSR
ncbi:hypothetical protein [Streptomyces sp. NPDC005760]|uniref:hypothetical protein n=1 Tax=Streptomyces sp. NPDC005760 TaxID=3156718 RepID=UPI00340604C2